MAINLSFNPTGFLIEDEKIICNTTVKLPYLPNRTILDNTDYGFYTDVELGGTKQTIILTGTPSTNEVLLDFIEGTITTSTLKTLYMTGLCFAPIQTKFKQLIYAFPENYEEEATVTIGEFEALDDMKIYEVSMCIIGQQPSENITLNIVNSVPETLTLTIDYTEEINKTELTEFFYIPKDSRFSIAFDGGGYDVTNFFIEIKYI
jgi:hypothetical protein